MLRPICWLVRSVRRIGHLGLRIGALFVVLPLMLIALSQTPSLPVVTASAPGAGSVTLEVDAPARAELGKPIRIQLHAKNAQNVAGYETHLLFDTNAAHVNNLSHRDNDLKKLGRDVVPLQVLQRRDGAAFGLASCPVDNCVAGTGSRHDRGGGGSVTLATVTLVGDLPGALELRFDATKVVDS